MIRDFTVKVYSRNNGTIDVQTMSVSGAPGDNISKFFCVDDHVFKYEIYDEFNNIIDSKDLSNIRPGSSTTSLASSTTTQWETLTACCDANWLLTENTNHLIGNNSSNIIILS